MWSRRNAIVGKLQLIIGLGLTTLLLSASEPGYTQEIGTPVRTIDGTEPGVHAAILSLKRTEGGILTFRIAFANETGGEIKNKALPGGGNVENFQLVDFLNKRKYSVMRTSDGACLCTSLNHILRTGEADIVGKIHSASGIGDTHFTTLARSRARR